MDLLVSGPERAPRTGRRRPARTVAAAVAVAVAVGAGWLVLGETRGSERPQVDVVDAASAVTVRPRGRDGELLLRLRNDGGGGRLTAAALEVPGVTGALVGLDLPLAAGAAVELSLPFAARSCEATGRSGAVVLSVRGPDGDLERRVRLEAAGPLTPALLAAGCGTERDAAAVALSLRGTGGEAYRDGPVVRGTAVVEVRNLGAELDVVRLRAEVPGALFFPASTSGLETGASVRLTLPFQVADCSVLRRTGRVVATVVDEPLGTRELGFRATEDEEARTVRDLDLEVVHDACDTEDVRR